MSPQPIDSVRGFGVTLKQIFKKPITQQYPEYKRPLYPRFRGRHRLWRHANGLEKCIGCSLCAAACPADCIRVVAAENTADNRVSAGRALRAHLRDQPLALHLLRVLRARVPVRRDHARAGVRDLGVLARRPHLHEGHAARRAGEAGAGRGPRSLRHADPGLQGTELGGQRRRLGGLDRRRIRVPRLRHRRRQLLEPVLLGALADRQPRFARRPLPAPLGGVRRRRAGARLRGRRDGHVPVRDRVPRPSRRRCHGPVGRAGRRSARSPRPAR